MSGKVLRDDVRGWNLHARCAAAPPLNTRTFPEETEQKKTPWRKSRHFSLYKETKQEKTPWALITALLKKHRLVCQTVLPRNAAMVRRILLQLALPLALPRSRVTFSGTERVVPCCSRMGGSSCLRVWKPQGHLFIFFWGGNSHPYIYILLERFPCVQPTKVYPGSK